MLSGTSMDARGHFSGIVLSVRRSYNQIVRQTTKVGEKFHITESEPTTYVRFNIRKMLWNVFDNSGSSILNRLRASCDFNKFFPYSIFYVRDDLGSFIAKCLRILLNYFSGLLF